MNAIMFQKVEQIELEKKKSPTSSSNFHQHDITAMIFLDIFHESSAVTSSDYILHACCCLFNSMEYNRDCETIHISWNLIKI